MAGKPEPKPNATTKALAKHALRYPGAEAGTSCVNQAFRAGKKAFFYLGHKHDDWNGRVKLMDSYAEAEKLATKAPDIYEPGKFGWVKFTFPNKQKPPRGLLERWIDESYRALVPKKFVDQLK
ncbi:MAG: MmcQ/YjbR family DNA-binding protein [Planctomycetota bacterium]|jgi:predicted DNA-binding protein (MmcQ/YjbR family)